MAIGRQCGYKILTRDVSLILHQRPWGHLDPASQKCKKFGAYGCCPLCVGEKNPESDREGLRDGHCPGQVLWIAPSVYCDYVLLSLE